MTTTAATDPARIAFLLPLPPRLSVAVSGKGAGPGVTGPQAGGVWNAGGVWAGAPSAADRAAANSPQELKRAAGSLAIALAITASTVGDSPGRNAATDGIGACTCANRVATVSSRGYGTVPVSRLKATQASEY